MISSSKLLELAGFANQTAENLGKYIEGQFDNIDYDIVYKFCIYLKENFMNRDINDKFNNPSKSTIFHKAINKVAGEGLREKTLWVGDEVYKATLAIQELGNFPHLGLERVFVLRDYCQEISKIAEDRAR